jgi:hypothetical protein
MRAESRYTILPAAWCWKQLLAFSDAERYAGSCLIQHEEHPLIHELRIYTCLPGRLPALQQRFETATLAIWERLGIRSLGFWTTMIGSSSNDLTYLLEWRSLAEREQKWAEFVADREWQETKAKSEADGPIVANIVSSLLQPTRFYRGFSKPSE